MQQINRHWTLMGSARLQMITMECRNLKMGLKGSKFLLSLPVFFFMYLINVSQLWGKCTLSQVLDEDEWYWNIQAESQRIWLPVNFSNNAAFFLGVGCDSAVTLIHWYKTLSHDQLQIIRTMLTFKGMERNPQTKTKHAVVELPKVISFTEKQLLTAIS